MDDEMIPELIGVATKAIVQNANRLGLTWRIRLATVLNGIDPNAVNAKYDGDTAPITMFSMIGPLPLQGRVYVLDIPPSGNYVIGTGGGGLGEDGITLTSGPADNTSSATLSGISGTSFTYKKYGFGRTRIDMAGTFLSSVSTRGAGFGVAFNGTDTLVTGVWNNVSTNVHLTFAGSIILDASPPGEYTVQGLWRASNAGAGITRDTSDFYSMMARELGS